MLFYFFFVLIMYLVFTLADVKWTNVWQKRILLAFPCLLLLFIAAFRFDVGYDYPNYYKMLYPHFDSVSLSRFEPLSYFIMWLAYKLGNPFILFVLFSLLIYSLVFYFCTKTKSFQIGYWTYVFIFFLNSLGVIRQAAAMSVYLCAIICMQKKSLLWYVLFCIIGSLFHSSCLIMLPVYFIYHYCSWKTMLLGMVGIVIGFEFILILLVNNNFYSSYLVYGNEMEGGALMRLFYIALYFLLLLVGYRKGLLNSLKKYFTVLIPAFFLPFLFGGHLGGRIALYFYLLFIFLIPEVLVYCSKHFKIVFMLLLSIYFFLELYMGEKNPIKSPYTPYQTIFEVNLEHPCFK